jgi:hypothetical protein
MPPNRARFQKTGTENRSKFHSKKQKQVPFQKTGASSMQQQLRHCMMTLAILGCTTVIATAQTPTQRPQTPSAQTHSTNSPIAEHKLNLTRQQEQSILQGLQGLRNQPTEAGSSASPQTATSDC